MLSLPLLLGWVTCRGVLNIVHGTHDVVNAILDHPDIKAISFVGSDAAGQHIYERGCKNGKRVQVTYCWLLCCCCAVYECIVDAQRWASCQRVYVWGQLIVSSPILPPVACLTVICASK